MPASITQKVLIISPFAFEPPDAGHRRRVLQSLSFFREAEITFLLYAFEGSWHHVYQADVVRRMRTTGCEVLVFRGRADIGARPKNNISHQLDEWYDTAFERYIENLLGFQTFDIVVVHNVWMSKYLDLFRRRTIKIIESHDIFSKRVEAFSKADARQEFFYTEEKDEVFGYNRADIIIAIQDLDERWISERSSAAVISIPYVPIESFVVKNNAEPHYMNRDKVVFGFLGLSHAFNIAGMRRLLQCLQIEIGYNLSPTHLLVAGTVCEHLNDLRAGFWTSLGWVPDENEFYNRCDIMIAPIEGGTGFKVKVADSLFSGKPTIATSHASIGISDADDCWVTPDVASLARLMCTISLSRPSLRSIRSSNALATQGLSNRYRSGVSRLTKMIIERQLIFVIDLNHMPDNLALVCLAAYSGAIRMAASSARQFLVTASAEVTTQAQRFLNDLTVIGPNEEFDNTAKSTIYVTLNGASVNFRSEVTVIDGSLTSCSILTGVARRAVPFGTNQSWDPLFVGAMARAKQLSKISKNSCIAAIGSRTNYNRYFSVHANTRIQLFETNSIESMAELAGSIIGRTLSHIFLIEDNYQADRSLICGLAALNGISVVDLCNSASPTTGNSNLIHDDFWQALFRESLANLNKTKDASGFRLNNFGVQDLNQFVKDQSGVYEVEYDADGREMYWVSGQCPLIVQIPRSIPSGTLYLRGISFFEGNVVSFRFGKEESVCIAVGKELCEVQYAFSQHEDLDDGGMLAIDFVEGEKPVRFQELSEDVRTLSFLLYAVELRR